MHLCTWLGINTTSLALLTLGPVKLHPQHVLFVRHVGPLAIVSGLVGFGHMRRRLDAHPPTVRGGRTGRPGGTRGIVGDHGLDGLATSKIIVVVVVVMIIIHRFVNAFVVMIRSPSTELRGNVGIEMRSAVALCLQRGGQRRCICMCRLGYRRRHEITRIPLPRGLLLRVMSTRTGTSTGTSTIGRLRGSSVGSMRRQLSLLFAK